MMFHPLFYILKSLKLFFYEQLQIYVFFLRSVFHIFHVFLLRKGYRLKALSIDSFSPTLTSAIFFHHLSVSCISNLYLYYKIKFLKFKPRVNLHIFTLNNIEFYIQYVIIIKERRIRYVRIQL